MLLRLFCLFKIIIYIYIFFVITVNNLNGIVNKIYMYIYNIILDYTFKLKNINTIFRQCK